MKKYRKVTRAEARIHYINGGEVYLLEDQSVPSDEVIGSTGVAIKAEREEEQCKDNFTIKVDNYALLNCRSYSKPAFFIKEESE